MFKGSKRGAMPVGKEVPIVPSKRKRITYCKGPPLAWFQTNLPEITLVDDELLTKCRGEECGLGGGGGDYNTQNRWGRTYFRIKRRETASGKGGGAIFFFGWGVGGGCVGGGLK